MRKLLFSTTLICLGTAGYAGSIDPPWMEPPVTVPTTPAFSWSGPYAGLSYGKSSHRRTYEKTWDEVITYREETDWEKHAYQCNRGKGHFGFKCDVTGLTHAPEFGALDNVNNPWSNNAKDETVRYDNGYDGLWMGADETFGFTLPSYVEPVTRGERWAQIGYEYLTGVDVNEWSETIVHTEQVTVNEDDSTFGGFIGYRHQFSKMPVVVGVEANYMATGDHGDFAQVGAQLGFAAGRVLPYVEIGVDHYAGGADVALGSQGRLLIGLRAWETHDGRDGGQMLRIGWNF
jgi:hypothetical protein